MGDPGELEAALMDRLAGQLAAPCSVMITSAWWRGTVITAPRSNQGTIRECSSPSISTVEGRQRSERSSSSRPGPAAKSSAPPMPEYCVALIVSATTWPWTSTAIAALIEIIFRLAAIRSGELTTSTGRKATSVLPSSHS